ncbi:hypothetical protein NW768_012033 [Fusarium equiseti]|uniref:Uncharacterized protein n=1 Tax=Fusarium equiseti TaxID=61235 RepID=A0ABQ8QVU5_FUSEQ|nr:hypothetical protein NW768_012033 [Fusarium equiseti]
MVPNQMPRPANGNDTFTAPQGEWANSTWLWPTGCRPEQSGIQRPVPTVSSSHLTDANSLPKKRTATMASLIQDTNDDDEDDDDDDDYDEYEGFFEITSDDDSDSTLNDDTPDSSDTDDDEEVDDGDKTSPIPAATDQHEDLASLTRQLKAAKTYLREVNNLISTSREDLDRLEDDMENVDIVDRNREIPPEQAKVYSELKKFALDGRKAESTRIYGEDLNPDFQKGLDNAAANYAEARLGIIVRHDYALRSEQTRCLIRWQMVVKELEIKDSQRTIDSLEKEIEGLRQKAKAVKIIDRVHELGVEGIEALMATGNETLEESFGISDIDEDDGESSSCHCDSEEGDGQSSCCHCDSEEQDE